MRILVRLCIISIICLFAGACPVAEISSEPANSKPIANAGSSQTVTVGDVVQLDGKESYDPDGENLTYRWELILSPVGSSSKVSDPEISDPTITPDRAGTYRLRLIVNDGTEDSEPATVGVHAPDYKVQFISTVSNERIETLLVGPPDYKLSHTPTPIPKEGYSFAGWYTEPSGGGNRISARSDVSRNLLLYDYWVDQVVTVHFDSGLAETPAFPETLMIVSPDTSLGVFPDPPSRTGYIFGGWFTEPDGEGDRVRVSTEIKRDSRLYAYWQSYSYEIVFDSQEATINASPSVKMVESPSVSLGTLPSPPHRNGYIFGGWFTGTEGSGNRISAGSLVESDMTVYAYWMPYGYVVSFDSAGADNAASPGQLTVVSPAESLEYLPTDPGRTGYIFGGWYTGPSGSGQLFTVDTIVNSDITIYAKWLSYTYTVVFNSGNASIPANPSFMTVSSPAIRIENLPAPPSRSGYIFNGWYTEQEGNGQEFTAATRISQDLTVYPFWQEYDYVVSFNSQGAETPADPVSLRVTSPATGIAQLPSPPVRTGYIFGGWFSEPMGQGVNFNEASVVTNDMTLYAYWQEYDYQISFNSQEADIAAYPSVAYVQSPQTRLGLFPDEPQKVGYTFGGWFTDIRGQGVEFTSSSVVSSDMSLYAHWLPNSGIITTISMPESGPVVINNNNPIVQKGSPYTVSVTENNYVRYQWYLNSQLMSETSSSIVIDTSILPAGIHTLMVVVSSSSGWQSSESCRFSVVN